MCEKKRKEFYSYEFRKKRKLQVGFCSDCFNSFKVTKLMREGNCSVSDERTGSCGLKLWKERSD